MSREEFETNQVWQICKYYPSNHKQKFWHATPLYTN